MEYLWLLEEMNVVEENACIALDQAEYQKKYDELAAWFNRMRGQLSKVG